MPAALVKERLLARIRDRSATTSIIGLGYVGLPLFGRTSIWHRP